MPSSDQLPRFTALLFGLSGGLVDFGARTCPWRCCAAIRIALPNTSATPVCCPSPRHKASCCGASRTRASASAWSKPLDEAAGEQAEAIAGAVALLKSLDEQRIPYAWQDELPESVCQRLAAPLGRADALIPSPARAPGRPPMAAGRPSPGWASSASTAACWSAPNRVNSRPDSMPGYGPSAWPPAGRRAASRQPTGTLSDIPSATACVPTPPWNCTAWACIP